MHHKVSIMAYKVLHDLALDTCASVFSIILSLLPSPPVVLASLMFCEQVKHTTWGRSIFALVFPKTLFSRYLSVSLISFRALLQQQLLNEVFSDHWLQTVPPFLFLTLLFFIALISTDVALNVIMHLVVCLSTQNVSTKKHDWFYSLQHLQRHIQYLAFVEWTIESILVLISWLKLSKIQKIFQSQLCEWHLTRCLEL